MEGGVVTAMNLFMQQHGVAVLAMTVQVGVEGVGALGLPGCRLEPSSAELSPSRFLGAGTCILLRIRILHQPLSCVLRSFAPDLSVRFHATEQKATLHRERGER